MALVFFASWTDIYQKHIIIVFALFCPVLGHCESCDKQFKKKDMMKGLFVHLIEFSIILVASNLSINHNS